MAKPLLIIVGLTLIVGMAVAGSVCFGSWLKGSGGCPARMPWEMPAAHAVEPK